MRHSFITGFPNFMAVTMAREILAEDPHNEVSLLVQGKHLAAWEEFRKLLPEAARDRVRAFTGDVIDMDLGLSGQEYGWLTENTDDVFHLAGVYWMAADPTDAYRVNVDGTAEALRFARECPKLRRFSYFSTAFVSGDRTGVVLEDDLEAGQRFRNAFEETRFRAERLVRRHLEKLPISIFRPSIVVGHSQTGEIDRITGPYFLMNAIVNWPVDVPIPLPGRGDAPMNLVPVDFVVRAARLISRDPRGEGITCHLTDPNPLPAKRVFELVARAAGRRAPRGQIPGRTMRRLLSLPGLRRGATDQRHFLEYFDQVVIWRSVNTLSLLQGTAVSCPTFESYVDVLVEQLRTRAERRDDPELEQPVE